MDGKGEIHLAPRRGCARLTAGFMFATRLAGADLAVGTEMRVSLKAKKSDGLPKRSQHEENISELTGPF